MNLAHQDISAIILDPAVIRQKLLRVRDPDANRQYLAAGKLWVAGMMLQPNGGAP